MRRYRNICGPEIRSRRMEEGLTQDQLAARLQLAGLQHIDRVLLAKIESQIRSVFDWELFVIADVLGFAPGEVAIPLAELKRELPALIEGQVNSEG